MLRVDREAVCVDVRSSNCLSNMRLCMLITNYRLCEETVRLVFVAAAALKNAFICIIICNRKSHFRSFNKKV